MKKWISTGGQGGSGLSKLGLLLGIQAGEGRMTSLALAIYFCQGFAGVFLMSASMALFLSHFDARDLSYVYIGAAVAVMVVGGAFSRFQRRVPLTGLVVLTLMFLFLTLLGGRLWFYTGQQAGPSLFLAILSIVFTSLTNIALWGLFSRLFDVRQAKRLFGLINSGEVAAQIMAGVLTPILAKTIGTPNIMYLSCLGVALSLSLTVYLSRIYRSKLSVDEDDESAGGSYRLPTLMKEGYPRTLHMLMALSIMGFLLVDVAFNTQAQIKYDNQDALAGFFGVFYAAGSTVLFLLNSLAAGRILNRMGVLNALFLLPAGLLLLSLVIVGTAWFLPEVSPVIFILVVLLKVYDYVFRFSLYETSFLVLYQPLAVRKRLAVQTSVESRAQPTASIIIGGLLLLEGKYFNLDAMTVALAMLGLLVIWAGVTFLLRSQYPRILMEALQKRRLSVSDATIRNESGLSLLAGRLESPHPGEVIYTMELLEENFPHFLREKLIDLLDHPQEPVRLNALARMERLHPETAREAVSGLLLKESETETVRAAAGLAYAGMYETESLPLLMKIMDHGSPRLMRSAMVGLLRHGGIEGVLAAGERLMKMFDSKEPTVRESAAKVLGEVGISSFYRPLCPLLSDESPAVRKAALAAVETLGNPNLIPWLLPNLSTSKFRGQTVKAITAIGEQAMPYLSDAFSRPGQSSDTLIGIAQAAGHIPGKEAAAFLKEHLFYPDVAVRRHIVGSLLHRRFQAGTTEDRLLIKALITQEVGAAAWCLNAVCCLEDREDLRLLRGALLDEVKGVTERTLALLTFLYSSNSVREAWRNLNQPSRDKKAYALEMLDVIMDEDIKRIVFPLLEDQAPDKTLANLEHKYPQERMELDLLLVSILERRNKWITPWTQSVALYVMGLNPHPAYRGPIGKAMTKGLTILDETGHWALAQIKAHC